MKTVPINLNAANDAPAENRTIALRGLAVLLARSHVRAFAASAPANAQWAPPAVPAG